MSTIDNALIQHLRSADIINDSESPISKQFDGNNHPKLPESLEVGEIALNVAKDYEIIAIKNNRGNIVYIPFNLTQRLLKLEIGLDDFEEYTMDTLQELSGYTVSFYESFESFVRETGNNFQNVNNKINQVSAITDNKIEFLENEIDDLEEELIEFSGDTNSELSHLDNKINLTNQAMQSVSANLVTQINKAESDSNRYTDTKISGVTNSIHDLNEYIDDELDKFYDFSADTTSELEHINSRIDNTNERLQSVSGILETNIENSLDEAKRYADSIGSGSTQDLTELSAYTVSIDVDLQSFKDEMYGFSGETKESLNTLSSDIDATNQTLQSVSGVLKTNIDDIALSGKTYTDQVLDELHSFSGKTEDDIENINSSIISNYDDLSHKIEEASGNTKQYTDDVTDGIIQELHSFSGNTEETINDINDEISTIESNLNEFSADTKNEIDNINQSIEDTNDALESVSGTLKTQLNDLSASTENKIDNLQNELNNLPLSGLSDVNITSISVEEPDIEILVNENGTWMNKPLKTASKGNYGIVKIGDGINVEDGVISAQELDVDQNVVSGSTNPVSGGGVYEAIQGVNATIDELSGKTENIDSSLSALTDNFNEFSGFTTDAIETFSASVSSYTEIIEAIEDVELVHSATFEKFKLATGVDENVQYVPEYPQLEGYNMTEAIDFIAEQTDRIEDISDEVKQGIIDDEMVHAAAFARINHSLGFTQHAEYEPYYDILKGMTVTEAIDYLYDGYDDILQWIGTSEDWGKEIRDITYSQFMQLVNEKRLKVGQMYKITNYQAVIDADLTSMFDTRMPPQYSIVQEWNSSMAFNVIVMATTTNTINENAIAIKSTRWHYLDNTNPQAWKIKYCMTNDKSRFTWASDNGFGVIYHMEDDFGNIAPYDFKNIMNVFNGTKYFTFHNSTDNSDLSLKFNCQGNVIKPCYDDSGKLTLNHISFIGNNQQANEISYGTHDVIFNGDFIDNKMANLISNTVFNEAKQNRIIGYIVEN